MIERSKQFDKVAAALLKAQPNIDSALKTTTGHHGKFADLTEVIQVMKKPLNDAGILVLQAVDITRQADGTEGAIIITSLIHPVSQQFFSSNTPVLRQKKDDPQALGSGITYAKRYGLQAMGLLPSEDDDGTKAAKRLKDVPAPTDQELGVIEHICEDLPPKEGFVVNIKQITGIFYAKYQKYPSDLKLVKRTSKWLLDNYKDIDLYIPID